MRDTLLKQFFDREWTPSVEVLLRASLDAAERDQDHRIHRLEFNLFDITIDGERGLVVINDILDADRSGEETISIQAFSNALQARRR